MNVSPLRIRLLAVLTILVITAVLSACSDSPVLTLVPTETPTPMPTGTPTLTPPDISMPAVDRDALMALYEATGGAD